MESHGRFCPSGVTWLGGLFRRDSPLTALGQRQATTLGEALHLGFNGWIFLMQRGIREEESECVSLIEDWICGVLDGGFVLGVDDG